MREQSTKLCECGCGNPAPISKVNNRKRGWVKGQPLRFIRYHRNPQLNWGPDLYEIIDAGYESPCWLWIRAKTLGYGVFREQFAHRVSYERSVGPVPEGLEIDHLCNNRACCNPDHLEAVTHVENIRRCHRTKVTQKQVEAIRLETGLHREVAEKYGLEESYVSRLRRGVSRPH